MKHFYHTKIPLEDITVPAVGAKRRWLIDAGIGGSSFKVAEVEVKPKGNTVHHSHPYEHALIILEGMGEVVESTGSSPIIPWEIVFIPPNELHQIKNTGGKILRFLSVESVQKEDKNP